jgi:hypothetical protein
VEEIGKILPAILRSQIERLNPPVVEILAPLWSRVAGRTMARNCRPVAFHAGTLTLACECTSWTAQLQEMAEEIRAEINSFLGGPVVKNIHVHWVAQFEAASQNPQDVLAARNSSPMPTLPRGRQGACRKFPARAGRGIPRWP